MDALAWIVKKKLPRTVELMDKIATGNYCEKERVELLRIQSLIRDCTGSTLEVIQAWINYSCAASSAMIEEQTGNYKATTRRVLMRLKKLGLIKRQRLGNMVDPSGLSRYAKQAYIYYYNYPENFTAILDFYDKMKPSYGSFNENAVITRPDGSWKCPQCFVWYDPSFTRCRDCGFEFSLDGNGESRTVSVLDPMPQSSKCSRSRVPRALTVLDTSSKSSSSSGKTEKASEPRTVAVLGTNHLDEKILQYLKKERVAFKRIHKTVLGHEFPPNSYVDVLAALERLKKKGLIKMTNYVELLVQPGET